MGVNFIKVTAFRFIIRQGWSNFTCTPTVVNQALPAVNSYNFNSGLICQHYSTRRYQLPKNTMEAKVLSDRQVLHKALNRDAWQWPVDPSRVLVIYFPWLGAKEEHINKYRELYTTLGLDILTVKSKHTDFLWPSNAFKVATNLIQTLQSQLEGYDHYILHSMSIGSYNLTILTMQLRSAGTKQHLLDKFTGIVFDSIVVGGGKGGVIKDIPAEGSDKEPVDAIDRMTEGVAKSVSKTKWIQGLVKVIGRFYFTVTKRQTVNFYEKALDVVRDEPVIVPTLVLASKDDPMSDAMILQQLVEIWKKNSNLPVTLQLWDSSPHTQHYLYHKEEYLAALENFLQLLFSQQGKPFSVGKSKL